MNHETHEKLETHRFRLPSPLGPEEEELVTRVIGCAIEVHKALGPGFLESIYKRAMCIELENANLPFELEKPVSVNYRGIEIRGQRIDLIVAKTVVLELKAISRFDQIHRAQMLSYLRTTGLRVGLLINFRVDYLPQGLRRLVL